MQWNPVKNATVRPYKCRFSGFYSVADIGEGPSPLNYLAKKFVSVSNIFIFRFATEEQVSLFMDSLWSLITLISSFTGNKYLGNFFVFMLF